MKLTDAIASPTELASWMPGGLPPVTVLLAPEGMDLASLAGMVRDGAPAGVEVIDLSAGTDTPILGSGIRAMVVGPLLASTAEAMRHAGSVVVAPHSAPEAAARSIEKASLRVRDRQVVPGVSDAIQHACDRVQVVAPCTVGPDGIEIEAGGLFFANGLDMAPVEYVPGKPWRPNGMTPDGYAEHCAPRDSTKSASTGPEADPEPLDVDLDQVAERVSEGLAETYLPTWREGTDADDPSLSGTAPVTFIPEGTEWPSDDRVPFASIVHLDVATLPAPARDLLGGQGLFQFFCVLDAGVPWEDEGWLARVVDHRTPGTWRAMPTHDVAVPISARRVVTGWRKVREVGSCNEEREAALAAVEPKAAGLDEDQASAIDLLTITTVGHDRLPPEEVVETARRYGLDPPKAEALADLLTHHHRDKLLGWPTWAQAADWPDGGGPGGMALLLQLAFDASDAMTPELLAGDGALQVFVSTDGERRFAMRWACG